MSHPIFNIPVIEDDSFYSEIGIDGMPVMSERKVIAAMGLMRLLGILDVHAVREKLEFWEEALRYDSNALDDWM